MRIHHVVRTSSLLLALVVGLSGCGSGTPSMMHRADRTPGSSGQPGWPAGMGAMMGGAPQGYHFRSPSCSAPTTLAGTLVSVVVGDMGMSHTMGGVAPYGSHMMLRATPIRVPAGQVSFVVANAGWRTHEVVVLPLAPGQAAGNRAVSASGRVSEAGSLGEASASCAAGAGDGIRSGAMGWVTLTLPAGTYELVCNFPNHYSSGMWQELTVA